tara:strand:- start:4410 stop:5327 length:918 start_codon:yes stop_codon:yes gene_type:complete
MADYNTTMRDVITRVRNTLMDATTSSGTLHGIKQVKRGILPSNTQFPVITVTPSSENIANLSSGNANIQRSVNVFVITQPKSPADIDKLHTYGDGMMEVMRSNYQLHNSEGEPAAFSSEFSDISYEDDGSLAEMTCTYLSEDAREKRLTSGTIEDNPTTKAIATAVYDYLNGYKATTLSGFSQIINGNWMGLNERRFPTLSIDVASQQNREYESGREQMTATFQLDILSKIASATDNTLNKHLLLVEEVRKLLNKNATYSGKCTDSQVSEVNHGQIEDDSGMLYSSTITLNAYARHTKPFQSSAS